MTVWRFPQKGKQRQPASISASGIASVGATADIYAGDVPDEPLYNASIHTRPTYSDGQSWTSPAEVTSITGGNRVQYGVTSCGTGDGSSGISQYLGNNWNQTKRTIIHTFTFQCGPDWIWNRIDDDACALGVDQKWVLHWRESSGGSGQRCTIGVTPSGVNGWGTNSSFGYTIPPNTSPRWRWGVGNGLGTANQHMHYGESGAQDLRPNSLLTGAHRFTSQIRRETAASAGDGAVGIWIDGYCILWHDGEDSGRPEYQQLTVGEKPFAWLIDMMGTRNQNSGQVQYMDLTNWDLYYITAE